MKFDPGKAWQHPVLRPKSLCPESDDYPQAEFEVDIEVDRIEKGMAVSLCAKFCLSDPDLLDLVDKKYAKYVLLVSSPKTRLRKALESVETELKANFTAGELSGRVDFSPFLIATRRMKAVNWSGWHNDFSGLEVEIEAGSVLAIDKPKSYWIDRADESPLGSIFVHEPKSGIQDEQWTVNLEAERVEILMSEETSSLFKSVRDDRLRNEADVHYLMNSLYLPALITVLYEADRASEYYEDYRWFSALDALLEKKNFPQLGSSNADRSSHAQELLSSPFGSILNLLKQTHNE